MDVARLNCWLAYSGLVRYISIYFSYKGKKYHAERTLGTNGIGGIRRTTLLGGALVENWMIQFKIQISRKILETVSLIKR